MLLAGWLLQGTAFSMTERDRLGVRGLLPPNVVSSQQQIDRFSTSPPFRSAVNWVRLCIVEWCFDDCGVWRWLGFGLVSWV